ncbi:phage holin family protein [Homoserinimonas sp. A447]
MGIEGLSSSVVIVLAAVLWLVYLVPTWLRRREYLSTERNAVRLQQTLRIMAETAEVPDQVRIEATTRNVAAQEKILQREMQRTQAIARAQDAAAARAAARQLAETGPAIAASVAPTSLASRRLRRSRAMTTVALLAALIAIGFGIGQAVVGGGAVLLVAGAVVAIGAVALLVQINQVSHARAQLAQTLQPSRAAEVFEAERPVARQQPVRTSWTPMPMPKPLYLSRSEVAPAARDAAQADSAAQLQEAAARAERALRAAQEQATPISRPEPAAAPANRFARMGIVEVDESSTPDLDEVLRRRRAV